MYFDDLLLILYLAWLKLLGTASPPSGVALVVLSMDATALWKASSTRGDLWVNVWGGGGQFMHPK